MSTAGACTPSFSVTGGPNPEPRAGRETTVPLAPETTCTPPEVSTASAATPPTVAIGLAVGDRVRPDNGARGLTRWAQTLPVAGSTMARVPPRRSTVAGTYSPPTALACGGACTADAESSRPVTGSMGTTWLVALVSPATAA